MKATMRIWAAQKVHSNAMGLSNIYVNLQGREAQGIVAPGADYEALVAELKRRLEAFVDAETGLAPVAHVLTRDEAYGTYDPLLIPDLFPANAEGYRGGRRLHGRPHADAARDLRRRAADPARRPQPAAAQRLGRRPMGCR